MALEITNIHPDHQALPPPPQCGRRLPPVLLDEIAAADPERVLYSIAKTNDMQDGFQDPSYKRIANAVNRCAHWLKQSLGAGKPASFATWVS